MYAIMPLTPDTMTIVLAYLHYYTPNFLPGRCLPATHLQALAGWLGMVAPELRSARANWRLAAHLALGQTAGLLTMAEGFWRTTVEALPWLEQGDDAQVARLQQALVDAAAWEQALTSLGLQEVMGVDYLAYLAQQLARYQAEPEAEYPLATWLPNLEPEGWRLALPGHLRSVLRFHLWQMGEWLPEGVWQATPYSIARAVQRGYSLTRLEATLTQVTGEPLTPARQNELVAWYRRHDSYRIRPAYVLSVKEPEQLRAVLGQRRWRAHIGRRLSGRHAVVSPRLIPLLERQLRQEGFALDAPTLPREPGEGVQNVADSWLALEVLAGLGKLISLPFSLSSETRYRLAEQLTLEQQAALEQKAEQVLDGLAAALRGRDAFFAHEQPVDPALVALIRATLAEGEELEIAYQGLGEASPRWRRVEPHWLEEKEWGLYLHGYCYLAEANRVFRLDRIKEWRTAEAW